MAIVFVRINESILFSVKQSMQATSLKTSKVDVDPRSFNVVSHKKSRKNDQVSKKGVWLLLYSPNQNFLGHAVFA